MSEASDEGTADDYDSQIEQKQVDSKFSEMQSQAPVVQNFVQPAKFESLVCANPEDLQQHQSACSAVTC